eukprot:997733-Prymnesium_polylepis.1
MFVAYGAPCGGSERYARSAVPLFVCRPRSPLTHVTRPRRPRPRPLTRDRTDSAEKAMHTVCVAGPKDLGHSQLRWYAPVHWDTWAALTGVSAPSSKA